MTMTPYKGDITRSLKWLQNNAPRIQSIINQKADWYAKYNDAFWTNWQQNVYDIRTANAFGLVVWCIILGIPLSTFNFQPNTNAFAFGPQRGNFLDGGGNTKPVEFVDTPVFYSNGTPVSSSSYTLSATAGTITYSTAPAAGTQLSWTATVQQPETGQQLTVSQPRVFGVGDGSTTTFSIIPSNSANYNEVGFNFYGGSAQNVGLLTEIRYACQLRYVALVSNGRQQWINQMLNYIFNGGQPWDFPNKKYFYLTDGTQAVQNVASATIWRADWQGNQLMYSTPRTNQFIYSQNFANSSTGSWQRSQLTANLDSSVTAPDGTTGAYQLIPSTTNATHYMDQHVTATPGTSISVYGIFKAGAMNIVELRAYGDPTSSYCGVRVDLNTGQYNLTGTGTYSHTNVSVTSLGNGWYRVGQTVSFSSYTSSDHIFRTLVWSGTLAAPVQTYAGDGTSYLYAWAAQCELGTVSGAFIPTTSAPVTVTDYTLNAATGAVTFATAPVAGADLTWSGTWNWATTPAPQSFGTGDGTTTVFTLSQPPGAARPVTATGYMEYRIGANLKVSSQFLNILNNPAIGIMPTCAGIRYAVVQEN